MQTYSDPSREPDPHALPDVEVFYISASEIASGQWSGGDDSEPAEDWMTAGWYYWHCFPGCLPDSDPIGPFDTAEAARLAAQQED